MTSPEIVARLNAAMQANQKMGLLGASTTPIEMREMTQSFIEAAQAKPDEFYLNTFMGDFTSSQMDELLRRLQQDETFYNLYHSR